MYEIFIIFILYQKTKFYFRRNNNAFKFEATDGKRAYIKNYSKLIKIGFKQIF